MAEGGIGFGGEGEAGAGLGRREGNVVRCRHGESGASKVVNPGVRGVKVQSKSGARVEKRSGLGGSTIGKGRWRVADESSSSSVGRSVSSRGSGGERVLELRRPVGWLVRLLRPRSPKKKAERSREVTTTVYLVVEFKADTTLNYEHRTNERT